MKTKFELRDLSDFTVALSHYAELSSHLPQIDPSQKENLDKIWTQDGQFGDKYWESPVVQHWGEIDIHITSQMWGNTSCGWQGMGGAAMSRAYNYIIHQLYTNLLYVYWGGKLAYIINKSEVPDLAKVPGFNSRDTNFIYKNRNR